MSSAKNCRLSKTASIFPTRTRLPARPAGTTCTYASTRPTAGEPAITSPQFDTLHAVPGQSQEKKRGRWLTYFAGKKKAYTMTQLALVIDLNVCVGCHACVTSCKEWNTSGTAGYMADMNPFGKDPTGTFFNRVQTFEVGEFPNAETVHFPEELPAL